MSAPLESEARRTFLNNPEAFDASAEEVSNSANKCLEFRSPTPVWHSTPRIAAATAAGQNIGHQMVVGPAPKRTN